MLQSGSNFLRAVTSINGGVAHINDQLSLRKGDISEAERLFAVRSLYKYRSKGIELTYTFDQFIITLSIHGSVHPISTINGNGLNARAL
jgi:hypothetical protein